MDLLSYLLVGIALAMDSVAVSLVGGLAARRHAHGMLPTALRFSLTFGFFQGAMTVAGYYAGGLFAGWLEAVDHWVAFGLLLFVGGNMIRGALGDDDDEKPPVGTSGLLIAGVATSIDALAVGVSFALLEPGIWAPAAVIAAVTTALCIPAVLLGGRLGHHFSQKAEIAGGLILIAIGARILVEHL